jgi:hypothetical protein
MRRALPIAVAAVALGPAAGVASADPPILYLSHEAAATVHDALDGPTLRQGPARDDRRWGRGRIVGKVGGRDLAGRSPARIAATLRRAWGARGAGGLVSIDELVPGHWTPASARRLAAAMDLLGPDARRVIFYASPALVGRVGRADPRRRLTPVLRALVGAASRGRATYLQAYRGDLNPLPPREMATHPTRWAARWPARGGDLRLILGPDGGAGQAELWARARSTPAGRAMLANGPAAYGLRDAATASDWAAQYRAFLAAPTAPARGGDAVVPTPGGLRLARVGRGPVRRGAAAARLRIARPGSAVVSIVPRGGGRVRALRKLRGPTRGTRLIRVPRDTRPGVYRLRVVLNGDGLRDRAALAVRVTR